MPRKKKPKKKGRGESTALTKTQVKECQRTTRQEYRKAGLTATPEEEAAAQAKAKKQEEEDPDDKRVVVAKARAARKEKEREAKQQTPHIPRPRPANPEKKEKPARNLLSQTGPLTKTQAQAQKHIDALFKEMRTPLSVTAKKLTETINSRGANFDISVMDKTLYLMDDQSKTYQPVFHTAWIIEHTKNKEMSKEAILEELLRTIEILSPSEAERTKEKKAKQQEAVTTAPIPQLTQAQLLEAVAAAYTPLTQAQLLEIHQGVAPLPRTTHQQKEESNSTPHTQKKLNALAPSWISSFISMCVFFPSAAASVSWIVTIPAFLAVSSAASFGAAMLANPLVMAAFILAVVGFIASVVSIGCAFKASRKNGQSQHLCLHKKYPLKATPPTIKPC